MQHLQRVEATPGAPLQRLPEVLYVDGPSLHLCWTVRRLQELEVLHRLDILWTGLDVAGYSSHPASATRGTTFESLAGGPHGYLPTYLPKEP